MAAVFHSLLLFVFLACPVAHGETQAELDRILLSVDGTLEGFLASADARTQYYDGLLKWLGTDDKRLPRTLFDKFLDETKRLNGEIPGLAARLMRDDRIGTAFSVETAESFEGKQFASAEWQAYRARWKADLETQAAPYRDAPDKARAAFAEIEQTIAQAETLPKGKRDAMLADYFKALRADKHRLAAVNAAAAHFLLARLPTLEARVGSNDPSIALAGLATLAREGDGLPRGAHSFLKALIPTRDAILGDKKVFPFDAVGASRKGTTYQFTPLVRRFHGIWKGVRYQECVGGNCNLVDDLSPRRFLTVALDGTQHYIVEHDGQNIGFTQHVPVVRNSDKLAFGSTEFGADVFGRHVLVERNGKLVTIPMTEAWAGEFLKVMPKEWTGIVKSDSLNIHNAGVMPDVLASPSWRFGWPVGEATKGYNHGDYPIAEAITKHTTVSDKVKNNVGDDMIFDAAVKDAGNLRMLVPFDPEQLNAREYYIKTWQGELPKGEKVRVLAEWLQVAPESMRGVVRAFYNELTPDELKIVDAALKWNIRHGTFVGGPLADIHLRGHDQIIKLFEDVPDDWYFYRNATGRSAEAALPLLKKFESVHKLAEALGGYAARRRFIRRALAYEGGKPIVPMTAAQMITLMALPKDPNDDTKTEWAKMSVDFADAFFRAGPSAAQSLAYLKNVSRIDPLLQIRALRLKLHQTEPKLRFATAADYLAFMKMEHANAHDDYKKKLSIWLYENRAAFLALKPTTTELHEYARNFRDMTYNLQIRRDALAEFEAGRRALDAAGFAALLAQEFETVTDDYGKALKKLRAEYATLYAKTRPLPTQLDAYLTMAESVDERMKIREAMLVNVKSAVDLLRLAQMEIGNASDGYKEIVAKWLGDKRTLYLSFPDAGEHLLKYLAASTNGVNHRMETRRLYVEGLKTKRPRDYLDSLKLELPNVSGDYRKPLVERARQYLPLMQAAGATAQELKELSGWAASLGETTLVADLKPAISAREKHEGLTQRVRRLAAACWFKKM